MFGISGCHCYHLSVFDIKEPLGSWPNIYWGLDVGWLCDHSQFSRNPHLTLTCLKSHHFLKTGAG